MVRIEAAIQRELFRWWKTEMQEKYPMVKFVGVQNENSRFDTAMGVDNGHPDTYLLAPWGILYLELKKQKGRLNDDQKVWNSWFDEQMQGINWAARVVAYGFFEAKLAICNWLCDIEVARNKKDINL